MDGDEIEMPKASRKEGYGEGDTSPADKLEGLWGSVVSSPSGVRGRKRVLVHLEPLHF